MVEEGAAVGRAVERPAGGVQHSPRARLLRADFPQLLQAYRVALRIAPGVEPVARDQLAPELAARAFGEHRVFRAQLHAKLEVRPWFAVAAHAHIAGGDAAHDTGVVDQQLGGGEAGEDLDAQAFGLLRQPAHDVAQADDVIAVVAEAIGLQRRRHRARAAAAEKQEQILGDWLQQRRALRLPVGQQLVERARVHDRARQDVRARLGSFLQHADRDLALLLRGELLEPYRAGQPGRACADDDHVVLHRLARTVLFKNVLRRHHGLHRLLRRIVGGRQKNGTTVRFSMPDPSPPRAARRCARVTREAQAERRAKHTEVTSRFFLYRRFVK
ncbi:hypothetical protein GALL_355700 [mine drainage metagenome]|uniref:Uncharacterized protein n=1 Tax=mine drainage metagenome TaxID=410659 RepID=A0A1J5QGH9_9ZZZZ